MWVFIANYFTVGIDAYLWLTKNKVYAMFMPCLCFFGQNCGQPLQNFGKAMIKFEIF